MKMPKNNDAANRDLRKTTSEALTKVERWPEWKRTLRVTKYSVGFGGKSKTK